jgi:hypothetical protein
MKGPDDVLDRIRLAVNLDRAVPIAEAGSPSSGEGFKV